MEAEKLFLIKGIKKKKKRGEGGSKEEKTKSNSKLPVQKHLHSQKINKTLKHISQHIVLGFRGIMAENNIP